MPISPETAQALAAELRAASGLCNESVRPVKVQEALGERHAYTDLASSEGRDLAIPILPSSSLENTIRFFGRLGFKGHIVGEGYAIVTRGELEVHFFSYPEVKAAESFAGCYFRVADVDKLYEAFSTAALPTRGIPRMDRLEVKPWRMKEFAIIDEDGNLYRIGQVMDDVLDEDK